uniref:Chymotrypsin-like serine protease n=1 Tax=Ctenocephalides felis TaxID=7515 RepID=A0A0K0TN13_CTEFE|nr:chymotrypsin-like serine protease [Ctenocephalides felis]
MANFVLFTLLALVSVASSKYIDPRIIGGEDAPEGSAPYQVSLRNRDLEHFCGGSILNKRWIVTAAHALKPGILKSVYMGSNSLDGMGTYYDVERFVMHDKYTPRITVNYADIGLIKVAKDIVFGDKVQPIKISKRNIKGGEICKATGWGLLGSVDSVPNELQQVETTTITDEKCFELTQFIDPTSQICTFREFGRGICFGDSGGPLVYKNELVGITSMHLYSCRGGRPDIFVKVRDFQSWINSEIEKN